MVVNMKSIDDNGRIDHTERENVHTLFESKNYLECYQRKSEKSRFSSEELLFCTMEKCIIV